jgi:hypothetical protein
VLFTLFDELVDFVLGQAARRRDVDGGDATGAEILGLDRQNAVRVDAEGDLNLGYATRGGRDARELEARQADISRSPWSTWIGTNGWLSTLVVKTSPRSVGTVVLRGISRVNTPPPVSTPIDSGVTSSRSTSSISPLNAPA